MFGLFLYTSLDIITGLRMQEVRGCISDPALTVGLGAQLNLATALQRLSTKRREEARYLGHDL